MASNNINLSKENYLFVPIPDDESPSNFKLAYYGWHKCDSIHTNYSSIKRCYTLHIVLSGKGYFCTNDRKYALGENDYFLINPAEYVSYYPDKIEPWEYIWFGFSGDEAHKIITDLGLASDSVGRVSKLKNIRSTLEKLKELSPLPNGAIYALNGLFFSLIYDLICDNKGPIVLPDAHNKLLVAAINYINENYNRDLTITNLSNYLYIDRTTLFKLFKHHFGMSPQRYIISYKLRIAQQYLCETDLPVTQIAQKCGFYNYSHFSRLFTNFFGCCPKDMREKNFFGVEPPENTAKKNLEGTLRT